jgi:hypothetical protein
LVPIRIAMMVRRTATESKGQLGFNIETMVRTRARIRRKNVTLI